MTYNTNSDALRALPQLLAKRGITHREGYAFDEAWIDQVIHSFETEEPVVSINYEVILHFTDYEPVNGLLEVRRDGTWAVRTAQ